MRTILHGDPIPPGLCSWDSMVMSARLQRQENDTHEADRQARKEMLAEDFREALSEGNVRAPALFVKQSPTAVKAPSLSDELREGFEFDGLDTRLHQLLVYASLGMDVKELATELIVAVTDRWAEATVDYAVREVGRG